MLRFKFIFLVVAILALGMGTSFAQVDDDDDDTVQDFFDSTVEFITPTSLESDTEYLFTILVTNYATPVVPKADWINQVDLTMPSLGYAIDPAEIRVPTPLHGPPGPDAIDRWEESLNPSTMTITWQAFAAVSSAHIGDIREGESLEFEFVATTDSVPTDGFDWALYSDEGPVVFGTAYVEAGDDDDDDDDDNNTTGDDDDDDNDDDNDDTSPPADDDDDTDTADDDDDDSSSSGCGC
jgi:hypothetical protein